MISSCYGSGLKFVQVSDGFFTYDSIIWGPSSSE